MENTFPFPEMPPEQAAEMIRKLRERYPPEDGPVMKGIDSRTVEGKLQETLYKHGLFEDEAAAVVNRLKQAPHMEMMQGRWQEPIENYPAVLMNVLWVAVKTEAVKWIDENKPQHWARPFFAGSVKEVR